MALTHKSPCSNVLKLSSTKTDEITETGFFHKSFYYNQAKVEQICPDSKSFYIVYKDDFKHDTYDPNRPDGIQLVPADIWSGSSEQEAIKFTIASTRGFDLNDKQIIMFAHAGYRGIAEAYTNSNPDITNTFQGNNGVSSYIVTGGKWELYTERNYQGAMIIAEPHSTRTSLGGANDKIQSIKYIGD